MNIQIRDNVARQTAMLRGNQGSVKSGGSIQRAEELRPKLDKCRKELVGWSKLSFGNNKVEIEKVNKRL